MKPYPIWQYLLPELQPETCAIQLNAYRAEPAKALGSMSFPAIQVPTERRKQLSNKIDGLNLVQ